MWISWLENSKGVEGECQERVQWSRPMTQWQPMISFEQFWTSSSQKICTFPGSCMFMYVVDICTLLILNKISICFTHNLCHEHWKCSKRYIIWTDYTNVLWPLVKWQTKQHGRQICQLCIIIRVRWASLKIPNQCVPYLLQLEESQNSKPRDR